MWKEFQILFLTMKTADVLKDSVKWAKILLTIAKPRLNPELPPEQCKIPWTENLRVFSWFLDMEMPRCVERYCEKANKTILQFCKISTPCIDDHHFKRRRNEICWRIVTSMFSNCSKNGHICHVLDDPLFFGQWTNLHDRSQNGPMLVTHDFLDWFLTFIIHVNTDSIVMWETMPNYGAWDCFKTPILQKILSIRKPFLVEHCAFWKVTRSFQSVGCRNDFQFNSVSTQLFGCRMKDGRYARSWFVGSDRHSSSQTHASERSRTERPDEFQENSWKDWSKIFLKQSCLLFMKFCY